MSEQRSSRAEGHVCLQVGQPFNPCGLFNGIFIPEALVKARGISPGAKITYGRLTRYSGHDGICFPAVSTLAAEIGMGERQTQRYLAELEKKHLIRRVARLTEEGQHSNTFEFLWHPLFMGAATRMTPEGVTDPTPQGVTDPSSKESQIEENHFEEKNTDKRIPGYASQKARSAASPGALFAYNTEPEAGKPAAKTFPGSNEGGNSWTPDELSTVRERIVKYWEREPEQGFEFSVMFRARGVSAASVCKLFDRKFRDKKLRAGGKYAPKSQNWFLAVIENELTPGHLPEQPAPAREDPHQSDSILLDRGIETIELPDAPRSVVESVMCGRCGGEIVRYSDKSIKGCHCGHRSNGLKRPTGSLPEFSRVNTRTGTEK